jgi:hypothetical protein
MGIGREQVRDASRDGHAISLELANLVGVVGHELHGLDPRAVEHVCGDRVVTFVVPEAEGEVRFDRVEALVL